VLIVLIRTETEDIQLWGGYGGTIEWFPCILYTDVTKNKLYIFTTR